MEPDFCVFRRGLDLKLLNGEAVLLAVEVADSSLAYDLGQKIGIYAAYGVAEVWVINALTLVTRVHRDRGPSSYSDVHEMSCTQSLDPMLAPELAARLSDLGLEPTTTV